MTAAAVAGFLPSTSGFRFANDFPHVPLLSIGVPGVVRVPIGDAANGLCGGMAFAVRDLFEAGRPPPGETEPPPEGSPLFEFLVRRLMDSFDLPSGPVRYLELMDPVLPDGETWLSRIGLAPHGRAWRMVRQEWPTIKADIDAGRLSTLGLVKVKSVNPFDLGKDHQVLAYGYDLSGTRLSLSLYDPNWPLRDDVRMSIDVGHPGSPATVSYAPADERPVISFFRTEYRRAVPPAGVTRDVPLGA